MPSARPDIITDDLPCACCGYNLRTLARDSACPECGAPVEETVRKDEAWRRRNGRWRRSIRHSYYILFAAHVLCVIAPYAIPASVFGAPWREAYAAHRGLRIGLGDVMMWLIGATVLAGLPLLIAWRRSERDVKVILSIIIASIVMIILVPAIGS